MGVYYSAKCVQEHGKESYQDNRNFQCNTSGNKKCIAVLDNSVYKIAPDVTQSSEFEAHYKAYAAGYWITMHVYYISSEVLQDFCIDQGREHSDINHTSDYL